MGMLCAERRDEYLWEVLRREREKNSRSVQSLRSENRARRTTKAHLLTIPAFSNPSSSAICKHLRMQDASSSNAEVAAETKERVSSCSKGCASDSPSNIMPSS